MDCSDIHDCGRNTYYLALALFKIQFEEIWHDEIKDIAKKLKILGSENHAEKHDNNRNYYFCSR